MKKIVCLALVLQSLLINSFAQLTVQHLLTENRKDPIGLDISVPRFSWQLVGKQRNIIQSAYEIQVNCFY